MAKTTETIKRKEVENSPFVIISLPDKNEHFATLGEYRITKVYDNPTVAEEEVKKVTWNRLIQVTMILIEKLKNKDK